MMFAGMGADCRHRKTHVTPIHFARVKEFPKRGAGSVA